MNKESISEIKVKITTKKVKITQNIVVNTFIDLLCMMHYTKHALHAI